MDPRFLDSRLLLALSVRRVKPLSVRAPRWLRWQWSVSRLLTELRSKESKQLSRRSICVTWLTTSRPSLFTHFSPFNLEEEEGRKWTRLQRVGY